MRLILPQILLLCFLAQTESIYGQKAQAESVKVAVYFELDGVEIISTKALDRKLDEFAGSVEVDVFGYTDYLGDEAYNQRLAAKRARVVAQHIRQKSDGESNIVSVQSKGEVAYSGMPDDQGVPNDRRVDVIFYLPAPPIQAPPKEQAVMEEPQNDVFDIDTVNKENITLKGLSFIPGRHYPTPASMPELEKLVETMRRYKTLEIEIQGYICCQYDREDGMDNDTGEPFLSRNRAEFVYDFLIEHGIDAERMSFVGLGSTRPKVFPELTPEDEQANRRVELKITAF